MILLTAEEAAAVRGTSPAHRSAALDPVPIKPDMFMLGEKVLVDPAHADVQAFLARLPRGEVGDASQYLGPSRDGSRLPGHEDDEAALAARELPSWKAAGVRK